MLHIRVEDKKMEAVVQVSSPEAKRLILDNMNQLREAAHDRGVEVQKFDVFVNNERNDFLNGSRWGGSSNRFWRNTLPPRRDGYNSLVSQQGPLIQATRLFGYNTLEMTA